MIRQRIKRLLTLALVMAIGVSCIGCSGSDNTTLKLDFAKRDGVYVLEVSRYGVSYTTELGAVSVRFDKNEYRADDPI